MMKSRHAAAAVFLLVSLGFTKSVAAESVPSRFVSRSAQRVLWIAASEAITTSGNLRPELERPERLTGFLEDRERAAQRSDDGVETQAKRDACDITYTERFTERRGEFSVQSLSALRDAAATRRVITGVVSATEIGLQDAIPYTVLRIDTADVQDAVYLLFPRGRVRFEGMLFCNQDPAYAELPSVGDTITFVASEPLDASGSLYAAPGSWIVYEHQGAVVVGPDLQFDAGIRRLKSLRAITNDLREARRRTTASQ